MRDKRRIVLLIPFLLLGIAVWVFVQTEHWVGMQLSRAQAKWRQADYLGAIERYETVYSRYPASQYADDALWEIGEIYYLNFHQIDRAVTHFEKIIAEYPHSPFIQRTYLKLAELHEVELNDLDKALQYWELALEQESKVASRRRILFKVATAHLKLEEFDRAFTEFEQVSRSEAFDELAQQSLVRMGTILQIQRRYSESVPFFQKALQKTGCVDCRTRAQLGLIETYQYLDDLPRAIETARAIDSQTLRQDLLRELDQKRRYYDYGPPPWNGQ
ncbi:MAG: tetratricopeptide repeat protein [Acidobacteriota bacterium]